MFCFPLAKTKELARIFSLRQRTSGGGGKMVLSLSLDFCECLFLKFPLLCQSYSRLENGLVLLKLSFGMGRWLYVSRSAAELEAVFLLVLSRRQFSAKFAAPLRISFSDCRHPTTELGGRNSGMVLMVMVPILLNGEISFSDSASHNLPSRSNVAFAFAFCNIPISLRPITSRETQSLDLGR